MKSSYQHLLPTLCIVALVVILSGCTAKGPWISAIGTAAESTPALRGPATPESTKIVDVLASDDNFKAFSSMINAASAVSVTGTLSGEGFVALFAPTEAAFAKLPEGALNELLSDQETLNQLLAYLIIQGKLVTVQTSNDQGAVCEPENEQELECTTLQGSKVVIQVDGTQPVAIRGFRVIGDPISADNGVIFPINTVIYPDEVASEIPATIPDILGDIEELSTFMKLLENTERLKRLESVGPYTIFAPTNEAFAKAEFFNDEAVSFDSFDPLDLQPLSAVFIVEGMRDDSEAIKGSGRIEYPPYTYLGDFGVIMTVDVSDVPITTTAGNIFLGETQILDADVNAFNGVIHIIDGFVHTTAIVQGPPIITDWCQLKAMTRYGLVCICYACPGGQFSTYSSCRAACQ